MKTKYVDGDLYNICMRVKQISDDLTVIPLEGEGPYRFAIAEDCADGSTRLVFRVPELDNRTIERLQYLMSIPIDKRNEEIQKQIDRDEAARKEEELDELYERVGAPMWGELEKSGFITRPVSYPKTGVTGGKGSKAKT